MSGDCSFNEHAHRSKKNTSVANSWAGYYVHSKLEITSLTTPKYIATNGNGCIGRRGCVCVLNLNVIEQVHIGSLTYNSFW